MRSQCREQNFEVFLKILVAKKMHCCILHCLKFPMNGFSIRSRHRKDRASNKRNYAWTFWCLLLLSSVNGSLKLFSGGGTWEELHRMWERMATGLDEGSA